MSQESSSVRRCRNCQTPVSGEYCPACGQREGRLDLHFTEAVGDVVGEVFTWDSRLWRTLIPLLIRPGFLSAEFNAGRRARYMPPFRLYIVISFVMFLALSFGTVNTVNLDLSGEDEVVQVVSAVNESGSAGAGDPPGNSAENPGTSNSLGESPEGGAGKAGEDSDQALFDIGVDDDAPRWLQGVADRIETNADRVNQDPSEYIDSLIDHLPQAMFIMLPLFAALLKLSYFFSAFHYLQHLVFALHYHSFVYLLYLLDLILERLGGKFEGLLAVLLLVYLPLALRRSYASGWGGSIGKALFLYFSYGMLLLFGLAFGAILILATL